VKKHFTKDRSPQSAYALYTSEQREQIFYLFSAGSTSGAVMTAMGGARRRCRHTLLSAFSH